MDASPRTNNLTDPVPGLVYEPDFLSADEESGLPENLNAGTWSEEMRRRVQHFGCRYDYKARRVDASLQTQPLPDWLGFVCDRMRARGWFDKLPDQLIVNEYEPGQGISPHVGCVPCFGPTIVSVCLGSDCVMEFTDAETRAKTGLRLQARGAVVLKNAARYDYLHGIPARKTDKLNGEI